MVVLGKDDIELIEGSKGWMERLQKLKCNAESVGRLETEIVTARDKKGCSKAVHSQKASRKMCFRKWRS